MVKVKADTDPLSETFLTLAVAPADERHGIKKRMAGKSPLPQGERDRMRVP